MTVDWLTTMVLPGIAAGAVALLAVSATGVARTWFSGLVSKQVEDASSRARRLAGSLGIGDLEVNEAGLGVVEVAGVLEGRPVRIRWSQGAMLPVIEVVVGDVPRMLWLRSGGRRPATRPAPTNRPPCEVGDPRVDQVDIRGFEMEVLALFGDDQAREALLGVVDRRRSAAGNLSVEVADGQVRVSGNGTMGDAFKLEELLGRALELATILDDGAAELEARVARHVRQASVAGVRARCLDALIERGGGLAKDAARAALSDPAPAVRLRAARWLGDADTLVALATDPTSPPGVARIALQYVDPRTEAGRDAIRRALGHADPQVLVVALSRAGRLGTEALPGLQALLEGPPLEQRFGDHATRIALGIARALGDIDAPGAEPLLLRLLDAPDDDVRLETVRSLGRVGSPTAVPALQDLAGPPLSHSRRQVEEAVARIQSRVEHADAGALSMAEAPSERGALSVAREGGDLSLPTEPPEECEESEEPRRPRSEREQS